MLTRRHFVITSAALFSAPIAGPALARPISDQSKWAQWDAQVTPANFDLATSNPWGVHRRFLPQRVQANDGLTPGDIHVDAVARYLYHIQDDGTAMRYGAAIARGNLYEPGTYTIKLTCEAGTFEASGKVNVLDVPLAPRMLMPDEVRAEHVKLSWQPPLDDGGTPIEIARLSLSVTTTVLLQFKIQLSILCSRKMEISQRSYPFGSRGQFWNGSS